MGLFRDGEAAGRFVELFVVSSWDEHLRQHRDRLTGTDRAFEKLADSLSNPPPETRHLLGAEVPMTRSVEAPMAVGGEASGRFAASFP
jgi:hypothetical protein